MRDSLFLLIPGRKERPSSRSVHLQKLQDNLRTSREEEMRIHGGTEMSIVKTINKSNHLAVTQVVDYVYCPRLLWLKMWTRFPRVESFGLLRGTNEHEVRRLLADSLKLEYQSYNFALSPKLVFDIQTESIAKTLNRLLNVDIR